MNEYMTEWNLKKKQGEERRLDQVGHSLFGEEQQRECGHHDRVHVIRRHCQSERCRSRSAQRDGKKSNGGSTGHLFETAQSPRLR